MNDLNTTDPVDLELEPTNQEDRDDAKLSGSTALPDRVIITDEDNEEEVLANLQALYEQKLEEWGQKERDRYYSRNTKLLPDDQDDKPRFPTIIKQSKATRRAYVYLPDGRQALRLDARRALTLCGIRELIDISPNSPQLRAMKRPTAARECSICRSRHLAPPTTHHTPPTAQTEATPGIRLACPKCGADAEATMLRDGQALRCLTCSHRIVKLAVPVPSLTDNEIDANERAIHAFDGPFLTPLPFASVERDRQDGMADMIQDIQDLFELTPKENDEEAHQTTPEFGLTLIEAENHDAEWAPETEDEAYTIADRIHRPIHKMLKSLDSPLRRELLGRALTGVDDSTSRMSVWASAGRFLDELQPRFLSPKESAELNAVLPLDRSKPKRRTTATQAPKPFDPKKTNPLRKASLSVKEAEDVADWLAGLAPADLALFAGDPLASHPWVQAPQTGFFEPSDRYLKAMTTKITTALPRFDRPEAGIRCLAKDFAIPEAGVRAIAQTVPSKAPLSREQLMTALVRQIQHFRNIEGGMHRLAKDYNLSYQEVRTLLMESGYRPPQPATAAR